MAEDVELSCPLCGAPGAQHYFRDRRRDYCQCPRCQLVFVPAGQHLPPAEEKAHYDLHQNDPSDSGYRQFLSRLGDPLLARLTPGACGLDFGAGPGPTLSRMLEEAGHRMAIYDLYYAPDTAVLARRYHFVTATEVVEHLGQPGAVLAQLWSLVEPGGWLGLMTKLVRDRDAFEHWHYKNDPTHISFFSRATFDYLSESWGARLEYQHADVILLGKPEV